MDEVASLERELGQLKSDLFATVQQSDDLSVELAAVRNTLEVKSSLLPRLERDLILLTSQCKACPEGNDELEKVSPFKQMAVRILRSVSGTLLDAMLWSVIRRWRMVMQRDLPEDVVNGEMISALSKDNSIQEAENRQLKKRMGALK